MSESFLKLIFEASITAGIAAAAVMLIRIPLKKAPKRWSYLLWAVVFFRCLCPFSVESAVSVFNAVPEQSIADTESLPAVKNIVGELPAQGNSGGWRDMGEVNPSPLPSGGTFYNPYGDYTEPRYADYSGYAKFGTDNTESNADTEDIPNISETAVYTDVNAETKNTVNVHTILIIVWAAGAAVMAGYGVVSYIRLMRKIRTAVKTEDGVYETDLIPTAFSAGFFPPKVYIPCGLSDTERRLIITHERVHIRRLDYITKPLAFIALSAHWFNPLIWAAFVLMTKDMELSCDEAVLKICGAGEKKEYSRALLRVSMKRSGLAVIPLAFAGMGIKGRVKNVLSYKKPRAIATLLAGALVISACAVLGTNAVRTPADPQRVLLEKGTTEFMDENGERIFFAYGDNDVVFSGIGESVSEPMLRCRDANGYICSNWLSDAQMRGFSGLEAMSISESGGFKSMSGGIDIDCDISEITINDIYVKYYNEFYYVAVSLDVLADDTFPEKFKCETWAESSANIEISGSDGSYTVNAEITAHCSANGEPENYGLALLGFDDISVYAAENLNIAGHIGAEDAERQRHESLIPLEKGTTEFEDGNGERILFSYGDTVTLISENGETVAPALRYKDFNGNIRSYENSIARDGFSGLNALSILSERDNSRISSIGGIDIDCSISEITIGDIYVKYDNGYYYVVVTLSILADDTLPEKMGMFSWLENAADFEIRGEDGRYVVNAEIKARWEGNGSDSEWHYALMLCGFDDIPVYAENNLKIVGHIPPNGDLDVKSAEQNEADAAETTEPDSGEDSANAENAAVSVPLAKGKTEFLSSGGERIFLSYKEENPFATEASFSPEILEKYPALNDDMEYVGFPDHIGNGGGFQKSDMPAIKAEVYHQSKSGNSKSTMGSLIGTEFDVEINSDVRKIAVNDLDIKKVGSKTLLCLDFDLWADKAWSTDSVGLGKPIIPDPPETSSSISVVPNSEDGRICNVRAEIEVPEVNVGYGLVLSGFEDIPISAEGKAAERFVHNLTNDEVKRIYQEKQKEIQDNIEKSIYPTPRLPVSLANIGKYGASNSHILFSLPKGTEVLASADGTVKSAKKYWNNGYGNCIEISHTEEMSTVYAFLDEFAVEVGDEVKAGDVIGYSGSSGDTLGDALLFEIRMNGIAENPWYYFFFSTDNYNEYQRTLEEISKDYVSDGIQGIYYEDGTPMYENEQETIRVGDEIFYLISTEEQLRAIAAGEYGMDKNFLQKSDIQLSDKEWIPIGTKDDPFTGSYNGNGFEINGLTMTDPNATRIGMFGWTEKADIYNITLRDYDIESAGRNAKRISVAPIVPVVTNGTRCYDNHVYPADLKDTDSNRNNLEKSE